jgi:hypothetical protein
MAQPPPALTVEQLRTQVRDGAVDTVVVAFPDMQGRLQGKRIHAQFFLDTVLEHGTEGCNYLLAVDVDMNTVDGYAISSWERGYGDFEFVLDLDTLHPVPWIPGTAMVLCDLAWLDDAHTAVAESPRQILRAQAERAAGRGLVAWMPATKLRNIGVGPSPWSKTIRPSSPRRLMWIWHELPSRWSNLAMNVRALPCWEAISLAPFL